MPELYIKDINQDIYMAEVPLHFMVAEEYDIPFEDIIDCGIRVAKREEILWLDRKPN